MSEHGIGGNAGGTMDQIAAAHAPRPVLVADLVKCAKSDCLRCHGAGLLMRLHHTSREPSMGGEVRTVAPCACAVKRFKKRHGEDVFLVDGAPFWKLGKAPESRQAA